MKKDDKISELQNEIFKLKSELFKMQSKLDKAIAALEFYGNCENHKVSKITTHIDGAHFGFGLDQELFRDGGKRARQTLKEIRGENDTITDKR